GEFPEFLKFLRDDPQFYAKTPQELLNRAAWIAKVFDGKSSQYFGYLPRMRFTIKPVPGDLAPFYTSGRGGPGIYLVNTYDLPHRPNRPLHRRRRQRPVSGNGIAGGGRVQLSLGSAVHRAGAGGHAIAERIRRPCPRPAPDCDVLA